MRQTNTFRLAAKVLSLFTALALNACSSAQQDSEELDAESDQQSNLGEDDAAESNSQGNAEEGDQGNNQYAQEQGADLNSDTSDEEVAAEETGDMVDAGNGMEGETANIPMADAPMPEQQAPANSVPMNPAPANTAPVNMNPVAAAPESAPVTAESPVPGGRVRYVREGGVQILSAPNGSPVQTLDQGEHPVTWEENGWLRITNGMYVPAEGMSDKGVPRPRASGSLAH